MEQGLRYRFVALILFSGVLLFLPGFKAGAQGFAYEENTLFEVRDLRVDETARSAFRAKERAFVDVQRRAFGILISKITEEDGSQLAANTRFADIESLISGIDILSEQSSNRRYLARISVRFSPDLFTQYLSGLGIAHVLSAGPDIRVVEKHEHQGRVNAWVPSQYQRAARDGLDLRNRIRRYQFHQPTVADRARFAAGKLDAGDPTSFLGLIANAEQTDILLIDSSFTPLGALTLRYRLGNTAEAGEIIIGASPNKADMILAAYRQIFNRIDSAWRARLLIDTSLEGSLSLTVVANTAADFHRLVTGIRRVPLIKSVQLQQIGVPESTISVQYQGRLDQLILALGYEGIQLQQQGERYKLQKQVMAEAVSGGGN